MKIDADYWIEKLQLQPHPEGGFYRENYRSLDIVNKENTLPRYQGERNACTAIYYLLKSGQFSAFHILESDEILHFYCGAPLTVHLLDKQGEYHQKKLGNNPENDELPQLVIPHHTWLSLSLSLPNSYSLIGCTVAPGFDFRDFRLGSRQELLQMYPQHRQLIETFTYS